MQSKIIFVVLLMLSFNIVHDSIMPFFEKHEHTDIVHHLSDSASAQECTDFDMVDSMLHFMAIITPSKNMQIQFSNKESIPHLLIQYTPPLQESTYKPPIA